MLTLVTVYLTGKIRERFIRALKYASDNTASPNINNFMNYKLKMMNNGSTYKIIGFDCNNARTFPHKLWRFPDRFGTAIFNLIRVETPF